MQNHSMDTGDKVRGEVVDDLLARRKPRYIGIESVPEALVRRDVRRAGSKIIRVLQRDTFDCKEA
jgi:hypothetical protein